MPQEHLVTQVVALETQVVVLKTLEENQDKCQLLPKVLDLKKQKWEENLKEAREALLQALGAEEIVRLLQDMTMLIALCLARS